MLPIHTTLSEMGWKQRPTAIQVEITTAVGIATKEIFQKKSKAMDTRFYWINNRIKQGQFHVFWRPVPENLGDYHSKHHPPEHHRAVRSKNLHVPNLCSLQWSVNLTVRVNPTKQEKPASKTGNIISIVRILTITVKYRANYARAQAHVGERTNNPVTANGITHTHVVQTTTR